MIKNKRSTPGQHPVERTEKKGHRVLVTKNGPYLVKGNLPLAKDIIIADDEGTSIEWGKGDEYPGQEAYALCRCGGSKTKPHCDGTHAKTGFDGTETASRKTYMEQADSRAISRFAMGLTFQADLTMATNR